MYEGIVNSEGYWQEQMLTYNMDLKKKKRKKGNQYQGPEQLSR